MRIDREEKAARAEALFREGYNCAQSVVLAYAEEMGLEMKTAARLSSGFGGGVGGGVVDRLRQVKRNAPERFWWLEVYPVKFGQRIKHKYYHDSTTYMMAVVKKLLQPYDEDGQRKPVELILPDDDDLVAQLSGRKYALTEASKIKIESKDAVKKRGQPSPDEADCVLLLCLPVKPPKRRGVRKSG